MGEFICDTPVHKGQKGCYHGNQFWDHNCYKCISTTDNENMIANNGVFAVGQSKENIYGCNGLRDVTMATNFWPI